MHVDKSVFHPRVTIALIHLLTLYATHSLHPLTHKRKHRITKFLEKPRPEDTPSRLASPVFYCLRRDTLELVSEYTDQNTSKTKRAMGMFMVSWGACLW